MSTLADRPSAALAELDRFWPHWTTAWSDLAAPPSRAAVEAALLQLLATMEDPGAFAPTMRAFSVSGAMYVAVYLCLRDRLSPAEVWAIAERATRSRFEAMRGLERAAAANGMFSWPMRWLVRSLESRSRTAPLAGWVARFVPGDGTFDYGVDYDRCAIHAMAVAAGAAEFAPFVCESDAIGSEVFGWGLVRTETLAQGGRRCDFRFRRGGETAVRRHVSGGSGAPRS